MDFDKYKKSYWFWCLLIVLILLLVLMSSLLIIAFAIKLICDTVAYGCKLFFNSKCNQYIKEQISICVKKNQNYDIDVVEFTYTLSMIEDTLSELQKKYSVQDLFFTPSGSVETLISKAMEDLAVLKNIADKGKIFVKLENQDDSTHSSESTGFQSSEAALLKECSDLLNNLYGNIYRINMIISKEVFIGKYEILYLSDFIMVLVEKCLDNIVCIIRKKNDEIIKQSTELVELSSSLDTISTENCVGWNGFTQGFLSRDSS